MQEQLDQLKKEIDSINARLSLAGMPYDFKEVVRGEIVKGENSTATLMSTYVVSAGSEVSAPASYEGTIYVQGIGGRVYMIPYLPYQ